MRQQNIHGYPLMVPSLGQTVHPGEIVEHDDALSGFEEVTDEPELEADEKPIAGEELAPEPVADTERPAATPGAEHSTEPTAAELPTFTEPAPTTATPGAEHTEVTR